MLKALVVSNGIAGMERMFKSNERVTYDVALITRNFAPELERYDLLVVPNGSDHVAMGKIKHRVRHFLDQGKALFCFDGWFTDWIPGNQWVMDNTKKTIDVRYYIHTDRHHLLRNVNVDSLIFTHGISGWWACGYIEANPLADVLLTDTWQRPVMVLDEKSTPGTIILTASGPLADFTYGNQTEEGNASDDLFNLYQNLLRFILDQKQKRHANDLPANP